MPVCWNSLGKQQKNDLVRKRNVKRLPMRESERRGNHRAYLLALFYTFFYISFFHFFNSVFSKLPILPLRRFINPSAYMWVVQKQTHFYCRISDCSRRYHFTRTIFQCNKNIVNMNIQKETTFAYHPSSVATSHQLLLLWVLLRSFALRKKKKEKRTKTKENLFRCFSFQTQR